ncbi:MAG: serine/threonine-protein kinase [Gemmatimonadaceae bacterium]
MPERYLGKTLGKYRVEELVGSGGFAWVYRGYDPELDIRVALKVLKPQFAGDGNFEERFRREASTAAKLRHPNIISIYSVGRDGDAVYFAMDFLPSGLADKLEVTTALPEEFCVRMGIDVARALGFAHREGVVHRDIKVDNILFDGHGNAVVADFGIARAVTGYTNQTGTNMVVGTPQYFAPEQARAKPLDGRADIYSLGVSLYRSATGRLPFEGDDWYEIARQHVEEPPPSPRGLNAALSPAFDQLILRCLAKHPDDRPATGEQLADELAAVLQLPGGLGGGTAYRGASDSPTLITPMGRPRAQGLVRRLAPMTILLVAVTATGIVVATSRQSRRAAQVTADSARVADSLQAANMLAGVPDSLQSDSARAANAAVPGDNTVPPPPRDTSRTRPPTAGRLAVTVPLNARVSVNGVAMGEGNWRADTLKPGEYAVEASVPASAGCESATTTERVRVRAGAAAAVTLTPRPCGTISINMLNVAASGARYVVVSNDGAFRREGGLPLSGGLIVPIGQYRVTAQQPMCAAYVDDAVVVAADRTTPLTFRVICDR